jgi:hypothetical protein
MLSASISIGKLNMALMGQSGLINSPLNVVSPPFAAQARHDDESYPPKETARRSSDAWAANGDDPKGCVQRGRSRRHRSSEGRDFDPPRRDS